MESDPTIASSTLKLGGVGVGDVISGQFSEKEQLLHIHLYIHHLTNLTFAYLT